LDIGIQFAWDPSISAFKSRASVKEPGMNRTPQQSERMGARRAFPVVCVILLTGLLLTPAAANAQEAAKFFKNTCSSCHTIGGGNLAGPDLKDVTQHKDREWLKSFIVNPKAVIDSGDPYALKLKQQFNSEMPTLGVSTQIADDLLDLIEAESKLPESQFKGVKVSERPLTAQDIANGQASFLGIQPLMKGGPACISCHSVSGLSALGGGQLGPDLTHIHGKMQTRKNFVGWLSAPATPTMLPTYKNHPLEPEEILGLVAYFEDVGKGGPALAPADPSAFALTFVLLGMGGAVVGLVGFDYAWRRRLRNVRRSLVQGRNGARSEPPA
jgi:mono/diheme cytochrome c family protein